MIGDQLAGPPVDVLHHVHHVVRLDLFRKGGEVPDVAEQAGHEATVALQRRLVAFAGDQVRHLGRQEPR